MTRLAIVALPRDPNPYQELLYGAMRRHDVSVVYGGRLTPSHTVNVLSLPAELAALRARGFRILHIHWTFGFAPSFGKRWSPLRRMSRWWFGLVLASARRLGYRIVWTAHNLLPHEPVFDDDLAARSTLVSACDLVIGHSPQALADLRALGMEPAAEIVIPHGPIAPPDVRRMAPPGDRSPRTIMFFGRVEPYKGLDVLFEAIQSLQSSRLRLVVAGACGDAGLRHQVRGWASASPVDVELRLDHVADASLAGVLGEADCLVFPFRRVTTSGSVLLAMAAARPVIVPDLPALSELPAEAVIRYSDGANGLHAALLEAASLPPERLGAMGAAGRRFALSHSWEEVSCATHRALDRLLDVSRPPGHQINAL